MTAKQIAIQDIKNEFKLSGKTFLAYKQELNGIMRKLVSNQIKEQKKVAFTLFSYVPKANCQIVAQCKYKAPNDVTLELYDEYYENK